MEQQALALAQNVQRHYGGAVSVEYVDLYSPALFQASADVLKLLSAGVPLPVVAFNGQPRLVGGVISELVFEELAKFRLPKVT